MKKAQLLWIDLEMTGLDPARDRIVEVAAIATDWNFVEVARYAAAVKVSPRLMRRRMVGEFWEQNSAVRETLAAESLLNGKSPRAVENEILNFLKQNFKTDEPIYLAGNSIHQDRKFIEREWSRLDKKLHYRMLDVSAWKIVFENKFGAKFVKPDTHRAIEDIEGSIAELKIYLGKVKR
ncbi:oligoribonuclease [Candidatus Saccharibacteria bacterium]|nr:oligoribonuclease [Candidatus Saccharibacteria bacterium]